MGCAVTEKLNLSTYFGFDFNENSYTIKSHEELYRAFDLIQKLPIDSVVEYKEIHNFYIEQHTYSSLSFSNDDGESTIALDESKCIVLNEISTANIEYDEKDHTISVRMTYNPLKMTIRIICFLHVTQHVTQTIEPLDLINIDIPLLNTINILIHNHDFTWPAKAIKVHELVLEQTDGIEEYSNDRSSKLVNIFKEAAQINVKYPITSLESEYETTDHEECNCYMNSFYLDKWTAKNKSFLSAAVTSIVRFNKTSFNAKGLMIFILFHLFWRELDRIFSSEFLGYYAKRRYNWDETALKELQKIGWIYAREYRDFETCSESCHSIGYHICTDNYYYPTNGFFELCGYRRHQIQE